MATITGLTAARMLEIEAASVVDGEVVGANLILSKHDGSQINAGPVIGPVGPVGPVGPAGLSSNIAGEIKLWPGSALPDPVKYNKWVWADGAVYAVATYPLAAGNIATEWRTFAGASDPGGANFRVPDLRGLTPVGMDAMPGGARANRMTRSVAIVLAGRAGEEIHVITLAEIAAHGHGVSDPGHVHGLSDPGHRHALRTASGQLISGNAGASNGSTLIDDSQYYNNNTPANSAYAENTPTGIGIAAAGVGIGIQNAGGSGGHENVQPSVFVPYIVCLNG